MKLLRLIATVLLIPFTAGEVAGQGSWPSTHHDGARTGRTDLPGEIEAPAIVWQQDTGGHVRDEAVLIEDITGDGQADTLVIVGGAVVARQVTLLCVAVCCRSLGS